MVVRDDLFPGGTKARSLGFLFEGTDEVVYASPAEAGILKWRENSGHAVMNGGHELVGLRSDNGKGPNPSAGSRFFPILPDPGYPEWTAFCHGNRIWLLRLLRLDGLPLEKAVHRNDAPSSPVRISERRPLAHGLTFGVDRLSSAVGTIAARRDQTPLQGIE
jgi:hypothetical protein